MELGWWSRRCVATHMTHRGSPATCVQVSGSSGQREVTLRTSCISQTSIHFYSYTRLLSEVSRSAQWNGFPDQLRLVAEHFLHHDTPRHVAVSCPVDVGTRDTVRIESIPQEVLCSDGFSALPGHSSYDPACGAASRRRGVDVCSGCLGPYLSPRRFRASERYDIYVTIYGRVSYIHNPCCGFHKAGLLSFIHEPHTHGLILDAVSYRIPQRVALAIALESLLDAFSRSLSLAARTPSAAAFRLNPKIYMCVGCRWISTSDDKAQFTVRGVCPIIGAIL